MPRAGCSQNGPGSSLSAACEAGCWVDRAGPGHHRDGVPVSELSFWWAGGPGGLLTTSLHPPWAPESASFLFPWREMRNICIFQPCQPRISAFPLSFPVSGCGPANSHGRPSADGGGLGDAGCRLLGLLSQRTTDMCRFRFWRPEVGTQVPAGLPLAGRGAPGLLPELGGGCLLPGSSLRLPRYRLVGCVNDTRHTGLGALTTS